LKAKERKLKDGCNISDLADRKNKITEILIAAKYPSENEFNGSVESFAKSNLKIEEIESLVRSMTAQVQPDNVPVRRHAGVL
jgi:hypothetical protein